MKSTLALAVCVVLATVAGAMLNASAESTLPASRLAGLLSMGALIFGFPAVGALAERALRFGGLLAIGGAFAGAAWMASKNESSVGGSFAMAGALLMPCLVAVGVLGVWTLRGVKAMRTQQHDDA